MEGEYRYSRFAGLMRWRVGARHDNKKMDILRFITAGSVDDGKSTLIGRLLYDTNNLKADVLESVSANAAINLAHITDGLRAERQEGITIDVAYKYFTTPNRKYIITDAPGHFQYTKNLVTGASNVDAIIILIDARNGITAQTRRHSLVASFLRIKQVVVAINKMDMMGYDEAIFKVIKNEYLQIAEKLQLPDVNFIPVSALEGDNISFRSGNMPWYDGVTLFEYLEKCEGKENAVNAEMRFSVQYVRDNAVYGKMISGTLKSGDVLLVNPQGERLVADKILHGYDEVLEAVAGQNICLFVNGDVKRGDILTRELNTLQCGQEIEAELCCLDTQNALQAGKDYLLRIGTAETICKVKEIICKTDNDTFETYKSEEPVSVNEFARVKIKMKDKIAFDCRRVLQGQRHRPGQAETGRGIIIDPETNNTSGAFIIL